MVKLLLKCGADTCMLDGDGLTAYQVALRQGHRKVADLLGDHGTRAV
jgi:ankyrin repeat protein